MPLIFFYLLFLVNPCFVVAVQPCMEKVPNQKDITKQNPAIFEKKYKEKNKKYLTIVRQRYHSTPSRYIDDQRILESNWPKDTSDHTQPQMILLDAMFF